MLIAARNGFMVKSSILPPGARWVEYLESTGTQWIDTGVLASTNTSCTIKAVWTSYGVSSLIGTRSSSKTLYELLGQQHDGQLYYQYGNGVPSTSFAPYTGRLITYKTVKNLLYIDDVLVLNVTPSTFINTYPLALFALNKIGVVERFAKAKVYYTDIYEDALIVRQFRPIAIGTTGYMLDLVSGEYLPYGNKGTGDFVIGPDINAPAT